MKTNEKILDCLAQVASMRLFVPQQRQAAGVKTMLVTVKVEDPSDQAINAVAALMGGTAVVRIGPDE